jgi:hypothetical protein
MQRSLVNDANGILLFLGIKVALRIWMSESIKCFSMLLGRLEILTLMALLHKAFWRFKICKKLYRLTHPNSKCNFYS